MRPAATIDRYNYAELAQQSLVTVKSFAPIPGNTSIAQVMRLSQEARLIRPFAQSPIVYRCVTVNADAFSQIPRRVWLSHDDEADEDTSSELVDLLDGPNPLMSGQQLQRAMSIFLDLAGGVFLFMNRQGRELRKGEMPDEIWPVRDDLVTPIIDKRTMMPVAWYFMAGEKKIEYQDEAVSHIYYPDPHNPLAGFGPMQAAWRSADHLFRAEAFDDGLVENGGQIGGIISPSDSEKSLTREQAKTLAESVNQEMLKPEDTGKWAVIPRGVKFEKTTFSPVDMQAGEMRKVKREEIARTFGVPPVMLGELEDANRSSLRELRRVYYENTIVPRTEFVSESLAYNFLPKLPPKFHERWIQYDYATVPAMREDIDSQIARIKELMHLGRSFEVAAELVGLDFDPSEGTEERWIASTLQPVELALSPPKPELVAAPEPEKEKSYQRRRASAQAFEASLSKHDDAIARAANRVFRDYLLAQRKRIRELVARKDGEPSVVRPWNFFTDSATWSASRRAYAELMDMVPVREWIEDVRGISPDELEQLLLRNEEKWGAELWAAVEKPIKTAVLDSAKGVARDLGRVQITATNPRVLRHMATKRVLLAEGPMSVVAERVRTAIVKAMADSSNIGTLAERIKQVLEKLESELVTMREQLGQRAMLIARTESASAANAGRVAQFKASGIVQHEWVSAGDDLVREGHQIDGEVQIIGERFSNGMTEPGEAGAPVGMVANCRCATVPVVQADDASAA